MTVHPLSHLTHDKKLSNLALRFYCQNLPDESKDTFACPPILHVSTGFIRNFCIAHNTLCLHVVLYNNFSQFLLGVTVAPRQIEAQASAKFLGANKMHYGQCESGEWILYTQCQIPRETVSFVFPRVLMSGLEGKQN